MKAKSKRRSKSEGENPAVGNKGTIIAHHGVAVEVLLETGARSMVRIKRRSGHVVGDEVLVSGEVLHRLPRRTELRRRDITGGIHLVGANLDVLGIVVASLPRPPAGFIDLAVVAARAAGMEPFLVVNKSDMAGSDEFFTSIQAAYDDSLPIFYLSASTGHGLNQLVSFFGQGHRGAFVGTTGVGKSSLLNALCPGIELRVAALKNCNERGCHTTTVSTLHALPEGGELIDTPGFQDFGLVDISAQDLASYFPGFDKISTTGCRFRDCLHRIEPGCAIIEMVENGELPEDVYSSYLAILQEVEVARAEEERRGWKNL